MSLSFKNLPCPFCGCPRTSVITTTDVEPIAVACDGCGAVAGVEEWNERPINAMRAEAFDAINSERDYQARKWGEVDHEVDAFAAYVQEYTNQLMHVVGTTSDTTAKLAAMRKVAALAVACMEQHGAPKRESGPVAHHPV